MSISIELWDQLQAVLSQLTVSDDLITEWAVRVTVLRSISIEFFNRVRLVVARSMKS